MNDLQYFLDEQSRLQLVMLQMNGSPHPSELFADLEEAGDAIEDRSAAEAVTNFMQWNDKALVHEMVEMESETGWKPWAKGAYVNVQAARGEWIDMLHFMLNGALVLGMDAQMIREMYDAKHAKNEARQNAEYDGVSTKCGVCHRALDDDAVQCHEDPAHPGYYICYGKAA